MNDLAERPSAFRRWLTTFFLTLFIVAPLIVVAWAWVMLHYSYSKGERAGYIQKISKKGWICKTWEGELAMANLPGSMPQIFEFSVRDPKVAEVLSQSAGARVSLSYEEHRMLPTACFGETPYFIVAVNSAKSADDMQSLPPPGSKPTSTTK
jgi:hypothetical protein